jgi:hypothetical protein
LLCKVSVNTRVNGPLATTRQNIAHTLGLNNRSASGFFYLCNFSTYIHAISKQVHKRGINGINSLTKISEVCHF